MYLSSIFRQVFSQSSGSAVCHVSTSEMHSWYWLPFGMQARPARTILPMSVSKNASAYMPLTNCPP